MGMVMSFMEKGMPSSQMINLLMGTLYRQFIQNNIVTFEDFHSAILDIFATINSGLPGKHYDVPPRDKIERCFKEWPKEASEQKNVFVKFMKDTLTVSKIDDSTVITGMLTPPAAMAAKKAGQNVPQLKMIRAIPDVIFVPSVTVLAIMSAKISKKIILGKLENSTS